MRIKLEVLRQDLPPVKVLWSVTPHMLASQLLEKIDEHFPLESDDWGFEDYAVQLDGYEILHYMPLDNLLDQDSHVTIRPLQTNDIRARTITGRRQITSDGRHLVDGVAFGRPLLRKPTRPQLRIPPRKRARLANYQLTDADDDDDDDDDADVDADFVYPDDDDDDDDAPEYDNLQMQIEPARDHGPFPLTGGADEEDEDEDEDEDDQDFIDDEEDDDHTSSSEDDSADEAPNRTNPHHTPAMNTVTATVATPAPATVATPAPATATTTTTTTTTAAAAAAAASPALPRSSKPVHADVDTDDTSSDSSDDSQDSDSSDSNSDDSQDSYSSSSSSDSDSDSDSDSAPSVETTKIQRPPPGQGKNVTRARNQRRKEAARVKYLIAKGVLPEGSTRATMLAMENRLDKSATPLADHQSDKQLSDQQDLEQKRAALLAMIQSGDGIDVSSPLLSNNPKDTHPTHATSKEAQTDVSPQSSRNRLDSAAARRILMHSLGEKAPKNDVERLKLQEKLASKAQRKPVVRPGASSQVPQQDQGDSDQETSNDPNYWKTKINLSAMECVLDDIEYIAPSFPFQQRWDPQMRDKKRKRKDQAYSAPRKDQKTHYNDPHDYYAGDTAGDDSLNYDDQEVAQDDAYYQGYYDESTYPGGQDDAASAQLLTEISNTDASTMEGLKENSSTEPGDTAETAPDLPPLPADLESLAPLTPENALPGAIITFSRLEASAATGWQPSMSPIRVACIRAVYVEDNGAKTLELQLAQRDVKPVAYDERGRRLLDKFEVEDEEEDVGVIEVGFDEVAEGRVIQKAEVV